MHRTIFLVVGMVFGCGTRTPLVIDFDASVGPADARLDAPPRRCSTSSDCDDGRVCNGFESCVGGACVGGGPVPSCDDGVRCTVDTCTEPSGICSSVPNDALCPSGGRCDPFADCIGPMRCRTGAECDDGLFCNGMEECDLRTGMCVPGPSIGCSDPLDCTLDTCSETPRGCFSIPDSTRCPVGLICDPMVGCTRRPCMTDGDCNDGSVCDGTERCRAGTCFSGTPLDCNDGLVCTVDSCIDPTGCVHRLLSPIDDCGNGIDDDCDTLVDCFDPDCFGAPGCPPPCMPTEPLELTCFDMVDNDCNGLFDCGDPSCSATCSPRDAGPPRDGGPCTANEIGVSQCSNGRDDDCDGRPDCADPDCSPFGPMGECCNGRDDDGDGNIDVFTCRCFDNATCAGVGSLDQVCWTNSFSVCAPRCNFYGGNAFCSMFFPSMTRCDTTTGQCMP